MILHFFNNFAVYLDPCYPYSFKQKNFKLIVFFIDLIFQKEKERKQKSFKRKIDVPRFWFTENFPQILKPLERK